MNLTALQHSPLMNWFISISLNCHRLKSVHLDEITQNHGKIHSILNLMQFTSSTLPVCVVKLTKQNNFQSINTYTNLVITATRWKVKARNDISSWTEIKLTINRILKSKHILWQSTYCDKKIGGKKKLFIKRVVNALPFC